MKKNPEALTLSMRNISVEAARSLVYDDSSHPFHSDKPFDGRPLSPTSYPISTILLQTVLSLSLTSYPFVDSKPPSLLSD
jgi:hypothetical protein